MESWIKLVEGWDEYGYVAIYRGDLDDYWIYDGDTWEFVSWEYAEKVWTKLEEGDTNEE